MTGYSRPFLAEFAVAAISNDRCLEATVVGADGLIYNANSEAPLIEEILGGLCQEAIDHTLITASRENVDPDTVRFFSPQTLSTLLTDDASNPSDPDLVRFGTEHFSTLITRQMEDPVDPDLIRSMARGSFETMFTKADLDPNDPDTVRCTSSLSIRANS